MTDDLIKRAREALDGVTPGEWALDGIAIAHPSSPYGYPIDVCLMGEPAQYPGDIPVMMQGWEANARFIAAARDLVPAMADRIEALEAEMARLRDAKPVALNVKPGQIERCIWSAMIWAASNNAGFEGVPEYTDHGNSFAENEARATAARILSALDMQPGFTADDLTSDERSRETAVRQIEESGKRHHIEALEPVTYRWEPYKPDGQRQLKAKGRWQRRVESGDYWRWENCTRDAAIRALTPPSDLADKVKEGRDNG